MFDSYKVCSPEIYTRDTALVALSQQLCRGKTAGKEETQGITTELAWGEGVEHHT